MADSTFLFYYPGGISQGSRFLSWCRMPREIISRILEDPDEKRNRALRFRCNAKIIPFRWRNIKNALDGNPGSLFSLGGFVNRNTPTVSSVSRSPGFAGEAE
jgi:hypothetical protein